MLSIIANAAGVFILSFFMFYGLFSFIEDFKDNDCDSKKKCKCKKDYQ